VQQQEDRQMGSDHLGMQQQQQGQQQQQQQLNQVV
jgi:hypothetical protein